MIEMYLDAQEERMTALSHRLDRSLVIQATPAIVFSFLTETPRWASWWGAGSEIDARPGGRMKIVYPGGREATGEVVEVVAPERIVFTYGYADGEMIPPGGSRVTIELEAGHDSVVLRVVDDGRGFAGIPEEHGGLRGMRERALLVGGALAIKNAPEGGVEVRLEVPAAQTLAGVGAS